MCERPHEHSKVATASCRTCRQNICQKCVEMHAQFEELRNHEIAPFGTKAARCREHSNNLLDRYCKSCRQNICRECQELLHSDHLVTVCKPVTPLDYQELRGMKNQLADMQVQMEYYEKSLRNKSVRLKEDKEKSKCEIKSWCKKIKSKVESEEKVLIEQLDSDYQTENKRYTEEIEKVKMRIGETKGLIGKIMPKLYNEPESPDKLSVNQLREEFTKLSKTGIHCNHIERFNELTFIPFQNIVSTISGNVGDIRLSGQDAKSDMIPLLPQPRTKDLPTPCPQTYLNVGEVPSIKSEHIDKKLPKETITYPILKRSYSHVISRSNKHVVNQKTTSLSRKSSGFCRTISSGRGKISGNFFSTVISDINI